VQASDCPTTSSPPDFTASELPPTMGLFMTPTSRGAACPTEMSFCRSALVTLVNHREIDGVQVVLDHFNLRTGSKRG
jgi:hypothetical protein